MDILVKSNDLLTITIHYIVTTNKYGMKFVKVLEEDKAKEMLKDDEKASTVKTLVTKWRPQTWQAQTQLFHDSTIVNPANGNNIIDPTRWRDSQFKQCLVDWDLKDDDGRPVPVSPEVIDSINVNIANAMSIRYAEATSLEEGEVGK